MDNSGKACTPQQESPIDVIMGQLEKKIENLHTTVCKIEPRIAVILAPPSPTGETACTASGNSPLETRLIGFHSSIGNMNEILADVLSRIQL